MITLVWRTDVHLSDRAPRSRTDDWPSTLLGKLEQIGEIAKEVGAQGVLDGGDMFNIRSPGRTTHRLVRRTVRVHREYPCPTWADIGNHDVVYGEYSYLDQQPLGVLFETGVIRRLYDEHIALFDDGKRNATTVKVVGIPYHGQQYDLDRLKALDKGSNTYLVAVGHLLAAPAGGTMFEGEDILKYADLLKLAPDVDVWCFGHWHKDQGIQEIAPGKFVVNVGSVSRGALLLDDLDREPACVVMGFDSQGIKFERRALDVGKPEDVFDIEGRVRTESRSMAMDSFMGSLEDTFKSKEKEPITDTIQSANLSGGELSDEAKEKVRERAIFYAEEASK